MRKSIERSHYQVTFMVLLLGVTAYSLLQSLVIPALPTIQHDLHTSQTTVTWVVTSYLLSASVFTPIVGRIGDVVGKERMLVVTLVALAAGSALAGLAHSVLVLIIARAIQGMGGGLLPLSFGIVRDEFPGIKVAGAIGFLAAMTAVGGGVGTIVAGPIVNNLNYHWLFWLPMIICILGAISAALFVPESPVRTEGKVSTAGAVLLSAWLVALLLGVSEAPSWGWGSPRVIGLLVGAVVLVAVWIVVESRSAAPLIDMTMMRVPAVFTNNLVAFLFGLGMYSAMAFLPEFLQTPTSAGYGFGASIIASGLFLLPLTAMMFLFGLLAGRIADRIGSKAAVELGSVISALGFFVIAFAHSEKWEIYAASALLGIGFGLAFSAMSNLIVRAVPPEQTGVASGMNANIRTIGGAVGAAVMASIVTAQMEVSGLYPSESGYRNGFMVLGVVTVFAALAAHRIPGGGPARHDHHGEHAELAMVAGGTLAEG